MMTTFLFIFFHAAVVRAADFQSFCEWPSGTYRVVALELSVGLRFEGTNFDQQPSQTVQLGFRDEKLVAWWFVDHGWEAMYQQGSTVKLEVVPNSWTIAGEKQARNSGRICVRVCCEFVDCR